jgi:hypothetical protein
MVRLLPYPFMQDAVSDLVALHFRVSDSATPDPLGLHPHVPDMFVLGRLA